MVVHSFPRQLGHLNFDGLLGFWPRSRFFFLLAWVAQVGGGPGVLFFACLLEMAKWPTCGVVQEVYIFQFASLVVKFVVGHGLFFGYFHIK